MYWSLKPQPCMHCFRVKHRLGRGSGLRQPLGDIWGKERVCPWEQGLQEWRGTAAEGPEGFPVSSPQRGPCFRDKLLATSADAAKLMCGGSSKALP